MFMEEIDLWLSTTLFYIAGLLLLFGLALVVMPEQTRRMVHSLNRWVSTEDFFSFIDKPRYQEPQIYRNNRIFGGLFVIFAALSIYMLGFYTSTEISLKGLEAFADGVFYEWLFVILYYVILGLNVLVLGIGIFVFVKPSLLKNVENWSNRWINTDDKYGTLDRVHMVSENDLPGQPRLFGAFVSLSALYMMFMVGGVIF